MTGIRSSFVLLAVLAGPHSWTGTAAAAEGPRQGTLELAADESGSGSKSDADVRKRAEDLAGAASERFTEILSDKEKRERQEGDKSDVASAPEATDEGFFAPVWDWLAQASKEYQDVIVVKLKESTGERVVVASPEADTEDTSQQQTAEANTETESSSEPATESGLQWGSITASIQEWLARANRSYRTEIVKELRAPVTEPSQPGAPPTAVAEDETKPEPGTVGEPEATAETKVAPAEEEVATGVDLPVANPKRAEDAARKAAAEKQRLAAEAEREAEAEKVRLAEAEEAKRAAEEEAKRRAEAEEARKAAEAEAARKAEAERQRLAEEEAKRQAEAEKKRLAEEAEAKRLAEEEAERKAEAERQRLAAEAEAKRKAAEEAEAKRKAEAEAAERKRLAEEEAKRKAEAEEKRLAEAMEFKRKAEAERQQRLAQEEAKRKAEAEEKRLAEEAEAKRRAAEDAARVAKAGAVEKPERKPAAGKPVDVARAPSSATAEIESEGSDLVVEDARPDDDASSPAAAEPAPPVAERKPQRMAEAPKETRQVKRETRRASVKKYRRKRYTAKSYRRKRGYVHGYREKRYVKKRYRRGCKCRYRRRCGKVRYYKADRGSAGGAYVVRRGDTLWGIARRHYGNGAAYRRIYRANRGRIRNPNRIYVNQRIYVPAG